MAGLRYNEGKTRHDLVPAFAQEQYAKVLTLGANKYAERNWEAGMAWSKVIASLKRHLLAIERGEDYDQETGLLHSAHVMCNAAFLTEYYKIYPQGDDRPHPYLRDVRIGLDIDEVLAAWTEAWCERWDLPEPDCWHFDSSIMSRFDTMKQSGELESFYMSLRPLVSPSELSFEPHCYVTSRPVSEEVTSMWLEINGFPHRPVYNVGLNNSKAEVVKEAGCDLFVDDRYENFVEINRAGVCCYLMDAPHNQRYEVGHKRLFKLSEL